MDLIKLKNDLLFLRDYVLRRPNIINGFIETTDKEIDKNGDYRHEPDRFGMVQKEVLNPSGRYMEYRPKGEQQNVGSDKLHCVSESGCNSIETIINFYLHLIDNGKATKEMIEIVGVFRAFGFIEGNKCLISTRYVASGSGTTRRGNSQSKVGQFIHKYGLVPKKMFPYINNWNEYYRTGDTRINGNKLPSELIKRGQQLLEYIEINYEWVSYRHMVETYKYAPLQTSGFAWTNYKNGIFYRTNRRKNHCFQVDGFENSCHEAFDSYQPFDKKLDKNYNFGNAMLYSIHLKRPVTPYNPEEIKKLKERGFEYMLLVKECGKYTPGVYQLLDESIKKVEQAGAVDKWIKEQAKSGKLEGISSDNFKKLLNAI